MEPNPYQSPTGDDRLASTFGSRRLLRWILVIALLPTPLVGGIVGLILGLFIAFRFFEAPASRPVPDITETGRWVVLACGGLGFVSAGVMAGDLIRRILSPSGPSAQEI
jgi:hypothetical protein